MLAVFADPAAAHANHPAFGVVGDSGLRRVEVKGPDLLTHGYDRVNLLSPIGSLTRPTWRNIGRRPPVCTPDYHQHVLYAHLEGEPSAMASARHVIRKSLAQANALLATEAVVSGGPPADLKVRCLDGQLAINEITIKHPRFEELVKAARAAGYDSKQADYLIFVDASHIGCGIASYFPDDTLSAHNLSNKGGGYAAVYRPCWEPKTVLHEISHTQGAVAPAAPNSTGKGAHCNQTGDVMCYAPDGGTQNQRMVLGCSELRYDCGFDDYFDAAPEPYEYLSSHWNLGSPLNRFLAFGGSEPRLPKLRLRRGSPLLRETPEVGENTKVNLRVPRRARFLEVRLAAPGCLKLICSYELDLKLQRKGRVWCRKAKPGSFERCRVKRPRAGHWQAIVSAREGHGMMRLEARWRRRR